MHLSHGSQDGALDVDLSPGSVMRTDEYSIGADIGSIVEAVRSWLGFLEIDLHAEPVARQVQDQRRALDELQEEFGELPDRFFTQYEAAEVRRRLDELAEMIRGHIEQEAVDDAERAAALARLEAEIDNLKESAEAFKVRVWVSKVVSKLSGFGRWYGDNRLWLTDVAKVVKPLVLPESADSNDPSE
ncbi:MAG TPA: hypothetical protein VK524_29965 [Polyangiaceae bacterium]|nr:hypothetical protein [Polyangiaceae bacterium]